MAAATQVLARVTLDERDRTDSPPGTVVHGPSGAIAAADDRGCALLGLSWGQMIGRTSMDPRWGVLSQDGMPLPGDRHPAMRTRTTGEPVLGVVMGVQVPTDALHSRTVWLLVDSHPVRATDGPLLGVLARFRDVTDEPEGRRATDACLDLFRLVAENASDVIVLADADGTLRWASPAMAAVLGWDPAGLVGTFVGDLVHPEDLVTVREAQARAIAGKAVGAAHLETRYRTADGGWRWLSARGAPLRDADGRVVGGIDALRDITDEVEQRRDAEEARQRDYRRLAENASDVVLQLGPDGRIAWVSPSVSRYGWTPDEVVGNCVDDFLNPADVSRLRAVLDAGRTEAGDPLEVRVRDASGVDHWVSGR